MWREQNTEIQYETATLPITVAQVIDLKMINMRSPFYSLVMYSILASGIHSFILFHFLFFSQSQWLDVSEHVHPAPFQFRKNFVNVWAIHSGIHTNSIQV